jgi:hypothetical protein
VTDQPTKQCRKCNEAKPLIAFAGRQNTCIQCRDAAKARTIERKEQTTYTVELGQRIADVLADTPMHVLVKMAGMPTERVIHKWRLQHPEFAEAYEKARIARADSRGHAIDEALDDLKNGRGMDPAVAKTWIDTQLKLAAKEHPQRWADKAITDVTLRPGKPLEVDTNAWLERVLGPPRPSNVIDLKPLPANDEEAA